MIGFTKFYSKQIFIPYLFIVFKNNFLKPIIIMSGMFNLKANLSNKACNGG